MSSEMWSTYVCYLLSTFYEIIQEVNDAQDRETGLLPDAVLMRGERDEPTADSDELESAGQREDC